jgi:hypothetical protein
MLFLAWCALLPLPAAAHRFDRKLLAMLRAPRALLPALLGAAALVVGCANNVDDKTANWSTEKLPPGARRIE